MFLPIGDGNKLRVIPFQLTTASLVSVCVVMYLYQIGLPHPQDIQLILGYGVVPNILLGRESFPAEMNAAPAVFTLITYQFLHGDFWHLLGNMLFLWVFGDNIEDAMGHWRFLVFYLVCGVFAAGIYLLGAGDGRVPMIGASGAVSGVIVAYLMLYPKGKVLILAFNWFPIRLPVWLVLGFWIAWQVWSYAGISMSEVQASGGGGVAWLAHIGGLIVGAILLPFMKRKDVRLFQRESKVASLDWRSRKTPNHSGSVPSTKNPPDLK